MRTKNILFFIFLFWSCLASPAKVRVLLKEACVKEKIKWSVSSPDGFMLSHPDYSAKAKIKKTSLAIRMKKLNLYIGNKKVLEDSVRVVPLGGPFSFEQKDYNGYLQVTIKNDHLYLVNVIDLEDYIFSVLRTEGWPGWPGEVNKVFAITSRSYVISQLIKARKIGTPFDVRDTNVHQTYGGIHPVSSLRDAVDETEGLFLSYHGHPILAMFDSCCGGIIPGKTSNVDFKKAPYLARSYACKYCQSCRIYKWRVEYGSSHLKKLFHQFCNSLKKIDDIKVTKTDLAGLVKEVTFYDGNRRCVVPGNKVYSNLKEIKSFCFSITKKEKDKFIFNGKGFGHHVGLCQWGAREMVRQGWGYRNILQYYYPGTTFMVLKEKKGDDARI